MIPDALLQCNARPKSLEHLVLCSPIPVSDQYDTRIQTMLDCRYMPVSMIQHRSVLDNGFGGYTHECGGLSQAQVTSEAF